MRILLFLFSILFFSCTPKQETITVLHTGDTVVNGVSHIELVVKAFNKDFPNVKVVLSKIDTTDGSTLTMDAMLAAGNPPNVYFDTMVRTAKYLVPEFALPLNGVVRDLDKYLPSSIEPFTVDGKVLGLPGTGGAQAMCINLDIMDEIGYTIPPDWTIDDFLTMAEKVKKFYGGKKYATGMFAANQSGDYLLNAWFASFGVKFYGNSYDTSTIASSGGEKVFAFYQNLVRNGYVPEHPESLNDDDYALAWSTGQLAATAFFPSWVDGYFKSALSQGLIKAPFRYKFVQFPRAPGVALVPTYFSGAVAIVHKTGKPIDKVAARLAEYWNSQFSQELIVKTGVLPVRTDVAPSTNEYVGQVLQVVAKNGLQDVGITDPRFTQRRALQFPILQKVLTFKISPADAIRQYESALSSVKK